MAGEAHVGDRPVGDFEPERDLVAAERIGPFNHHVRVVQRAAVPRTLDSDP